MPDIVVTVFALTVLLVLVSVLMPLAERLMLPHSVLLAALGLGLGLLDAVVGQAPDLGLAGRALQALASLGIGADALLLVFLPPLLFTAGLSIDVRLLIDEVAAVLLLAVVAVLVSTAVIGGALAAATEVGVVACFLLGAIVSPTDPAAVVAVFRDIGAPRRLSVLVAGESLFNDAAAIAGFTVLMAMLTGERPIDPGEGVADFLLEMAGGALFGYAFARLTCAVLPLLGEISIAEITVSVALAYLSYVLADFWLDLSGVVAVVTAALTFAVYGRTRLAPETWDTLTESWGHLEFWASSLIFVLAAMLASRVLPEARLADLGLLALLVLAALAARALVLYGLWPALIAARLAAPVGNPYKTVILWGGLRGAVTLALALAVSQHPMVSADVRHFVAVLATAFVLFTMFVGAPTLRPLLHLLKLDRLGPMELALRDRVTALTRRTVGEEVQAIARGYGLDPARAGVPAAEAPADDADAMPLAAEDLERVGLVTLAGREKELYLKHFRERTISRRMVGRFVASADRLIDRVKAGGEAGYELVSREEVRLSRPFRLALWLHRRLGWSGLLARLLADRFESLIALRLVLGELVLFNSESIRPLLGRSCSARLGAVLARRLATVEDALAAVELLYPSYTAALRGQYLERAALRVEAGEYRRKFEETVIGREVYSNLLAGLRARRAALERRPPLDLGFDLLAMIRRVPLFSALDEDRLFAIARLLRPHLAMPGERLVRKGAHGGEMFFIASGAVEVKLRKAPVTLQAGDFFGELALLTRKPRTADVVSTGYCHLLVLDGREFRRLLRQNPGLEADVRAVAETRLAAAEEAGA